MGIFGQSTGFDADVEKATTEANTNENWTLILDVCDKVLSNPRNAKECLKAIMRRMGHNDPHVVMQAITLLDACVSNCGKTFHLEIASREFQNQFIALLGKAQRKVQLKMCEVLKGWAEGDFKNDPELNLIPSLYAKLRQENYEFVTSTDKTAKSAAKLAAVAAAAAKDPNVVTSQQEEDDLAKAIELSLKETKNSPKLGPSGGAVSANYPSLYPSVSATGTAAAGVVPSSSHPEPRKVRALYDFEAAEENELTFVAGEIIHVVDDSDPNWWKGYNQRGEGLFPSNFVSADLSIDPERLEINQQHKMKKSTQFEEDSKELQQKTEAAAAAAAAQSVDIDEQKIDRLLHLLNEANPEDPSQDTEEMLRLEQEVHQMGPLIDAELERVDRKHAQLSQLSSDLVDAINLYHSLMRDDRNALGSPYNIPVAMSSMQGGGMPGYPPHSGMMYGSNSPYSGSFGRHSLPPIINSLPYSPPSGNFQPQPQMSSIPMQFQNGHVNQAQQAPPAPQHALQGLPHHMNPQMMAAPQTNPTQQQPPIYGPQQHMASNNVAAAGGDSQQQQQPPNHNHYSQMLPTQHQQQQQHYIPQQAPPTVTAAAPMPTNQMAPPNQQQTHARQQFMSPHHVQQQQQHQQSYMNSPSAQPSTNPHLYNPSSMAAPQPPQSLPSNMTPHSHTGPLDQFGQLQQQMANMSVAGQHQPYQTNLPQNIPIYQQQR